MWSPAHVVTDCVHLRPFHERQTMQASLLKLFPAAPLFGATVPQRTQIASKLYYGSQRVNAWYPGSGPLPGECGIVTADLRRGPDAHVLPSLLGCVVAHCCRLAR